MHYIVVLVREIEGLGLLKKDTMPYNYLLNPIFGKCAPQI